MSVAYPLRTLALTAVVCALASAGLSGKAQATSYPTTISQTHVLSFDTIGIAKENSMTPTWAQAAPWLSDNDSQNTTDAQTGEALGITQTFYTNSAMQHAGAPLWPTDESEFAHDCLGNRISTITYGSNVFLLNPSSPLLLAQWVTFVQDSIARGYPVDHVMADSADNVTKFQTLPCNNAQHNGFDQALWDKALIAQYTSFTAQVNRPIIFNGLYIIHPNDGTQLSPGFALDTVPGVSGGETEECYTRVEPFGPGQTGTDWAALENTEATQMARGKVWYCSGNTAAQGTPDASQVIPYRMYEFASFMLTYKHTLAYIHEGYNTASGFRQNVEEQLVALHPVASAPTSIAALQVNGTYYERKYNACYIAGSFIGPCAFVVNSDKSATYSLNSAGYAHTLLVSGSDIFDGGTISATGPAAPSTIGPHTAYVLTN